MPAFVVPSAAIIFYTSRYICYYVELLFEAQCVIGLYNCELTWKWTGNLILKLVCFLQLFDLGAPSAVPRHC